MQDQGSQCEPPAYAADYDALYRSSFGPQPARRTREQACGNASAYESAESEQVQTASIPGADQKDAREMPETHQNSAFIVQRRRYPERVHPDYRKWLPQTVYERDLVADQTVRGLRRDPPGLSVIRDPSQYDRERERDRGIRGVPRGSIPSEDFRVEVVRGRKAESEQNTRENAPLQPCDLQTKRGTASDLLRQEEELRHALQWQTLRNSAAYQNSICGSRAPGATGGAQKHKKRGFVTGQKQRRIERPGRS